MLSKELTSDDWTKIARGEWKPKPYDLRMAGFDALKLLKRAESAEAELLSLREQLAEKEERLCRLCTSLEIEMKGHEAVERQLAELKALPPVGYVGNSDLYALSTGDLGCIAPYNAFEGIPLFTAAKPAEIPRHIYSMLVNELRDVPAIGCKRELIIGVLNRHGVTAEPVQFDPPATE